jgi:hypothetical protein
MCDPITMAVMAVGQGVMQYQQQKQQSEYSNKLADAQNEAAHKAMEDSGRQLNARQDQENQALADKRMQNLVAYMENVGEAQVALDARGITGGRTAEFDLAQREADKLSLDTQTNRQIDAVSTAYAFERSGLQSTLENRLMNNNSKRIAKPSLGMAVATTAMNATMAYGAGNSGLGDKGQGLSFGENWSNFKSTYSFG